MIVYRWIVAVAASSSLLDRWTKSLIVSTSPRARAAIVIPHLLWWTYVQNTHGAFGFFGCTGAADRDRAAGARPFWFAFATPARKSLLVRIAFGGIVGGAVGNIVDRLHHRYVVDFIDFKTHSGPTCSTSPTRASPSASGS